MTRLTYLAACFVGYLAHYSVAEKNSRGYTYGDKGQSKDDAGSNGEVINITYNVAPKGQDGSSPVQNVAAPQSTVAMTHQVYRRHILYFLVRWLTRYLLQVFVGGAAGLVFTPNTIQAAVGDTVQFNFMSKNHTVTQSSFAKPCVKLAEGVDSGFLANPDNLKNPPPSFLFAVKDKKPTCKPVFSHCSVSR